MARAQQGSYIYVAGIDVCAGGPFWQSSRLQAPCSIHSPPPPQVSVAIVLALIAPSSLDDPQFFLKSHEQQERFDDVGGESVGGALVAGALVGGALVGGEVVCGALVGGVRVGEKMGGQQGRRESSVGQVTCSYVMATLFQ